MLQKFKLTKLAKSCVSAEAIEVNDGGYEGEMSSPTYNKKM